MEKLCVNCGTPFEYTPRKGGGGRVKQYCTHACYNQVFNAAKYAANKEVMKEQKRQDMNKWRKTHLKEARERNRRYREQHRKELAQKQVPYTIARRARKARAPINDFSSAQWQEMKIAFENRCAYCDKECIRLEMDHITAISQGGSHTLHNIVPACRSCNASKHDKGPLVPVQPLLLTLSNPTKLIGLRNVAVT